MGWDGVGWGMYGLLWNGMGWNKKIMPMDKPVKKGKKKQKAQTISTKEKLWLT